MLVDWRQDWNLIDDFQVESTKIEGLSFLGVVGQQTNLAKPEVFEDLNSNTVVTHVGFVAKGRVCFDRVEPLILQSVSFDLFGQTDAAPFLRQVDQHAMTFPRDHTHREVQLVTAVASQRVDQIAGKATTVHSD